MKLIVCVLFRFVHSACDPEADLSTYHAKKEQNPDYEYSCLPCKALVQNGRLAASMRRNNSIEDDSMSASQESLGAYDDQVDNASMISTTTIVDAAEKMGGTSDFGLGKGKPLSTTKMIAKKRLVGMPGSVGRPKGGGKFNFQKKQRTAEFGRKRGPKAKMRGVFGVPGLGLQRPTSDASNKADDEPGVENRLVLCSAKDKFVLTQDICVMCGAIGTDQEGCLISCLQCGQCYHPYCVTVKVTKVILQRGWRCLDCTVCEGCGQKHDESRLILCDDCDISYHIYCIDPPLDIVPHGTWKCKWCAVCQKCGSNSPGVNCAWQNGFTECGPCASQSQCASCFDGYADGDLIIQCSNCDRWLHCNCDDILTEEEAEKCVDDGYKCVLCRPKDVLPPHLQPTKKALPAPPSAAKTAPTSAIAIKSTVSDDTNGSDVANGPSLGLEGNHLMDGVYLSGNGLTQIKSLQMELTRKKRKTKLLAIEPPPVMTSVKDQEAGIMAAIESVVAGSSLDNSLEEIKVEPMDPREEAEIYKDGMVWDRTEVSAPEGFTLCRNDQGVVILRKKRQRNLQKLGIGGFVVRNRTVRKDDPFKDADATGDDFNDSLVPQFISETSANASSADKKKKPIRKKAKSKLADTYPSYLQEAFFGKGLLDKTKPKFESSSSEDEAKSTVSDDKTIQLSTEELNIINANRIKQQQQMQLQQQNQQQLQQKWLNDKNKLAAAATQAKKIIVPQQMATKMETTNPNGQSPQLAIVKTEPRTSDFIVKNEPGVVSADSQKNELNDILDSHFKMDTDVDEMIKGVLTEESQVRKITRTIRFRHSYTFFLLF